MIHYDDVCTFENILDAFYKTRKGKGHKREVIDFGSNLSREMTKMYDDLFQRKYQMNPYYSFTVYEPKKREIFACDYRDRVMIRWICDNILIPVLSNYYIHDNAACQKGKGLHFAQNRFKKHLLKYYNKNGSEGYVLKCDIAGYFSSIDQSILKEKLKKCKFDNDTLKMLEQIIDSFYQQERGKGIPLGNQTSQHFGLFYLSSMDVYIKEKLKIKYYTRYMDDFLLIHENKKYLQDCKKNLENLLQEEFKLALNNKSEVVPLKNGVEYLGFRFYLNNNGKVFMKLKKQSKVRLKNNIKKRKSDFQKKKISINELENFIASFEGNARHGDTFNLMRHLYKKCVFVKG